MRRNTLSSILVFTFIFLFFLFLAGYALAQQKPQQYNADTQRPPKTYTQPLLKQKLPRPQPPKVTYFKINKGDAITYFRRVSLDNGTERATQYRASQNSEFNGAQWKPLIIQPIPHFGNSHPKFELSEGSGPKRVYFQVKDQVGQVSNVVNDTIHLEDPYSGP